MGLISTVEQTIERWTSALWAILVPSPQQHAEVVSILHRECDDNALILDRQRVLVPNAFVIELPSESHSQLTAHSEEVSRQLASQVCRHAAEHGYTFAGPVAVALRPSANESVGRFQIRSRIDPTEARCPKARSGDA
ncbi:DUF3662 domain-containing protein [Streptomyces sp. NPDC058308]|uniref:DUF3662 domain-containing protein n=1 Tax=Streptomyces sp. NPDC058308 TaxID=3346440 RepID=UPI0036E56A76